MVERDIWEVCNQLGGYVGPDTEERLARFLLREAKAAEDLATEITRLRAEVERLTAKAAEWDRRDGIDGAACSAIREMLASMGVPPAAFIDDHVANAYLHGKAEERERAAQIAEETATRLAENDDEGIDRFDACMIVAAAIRKAGQEVERLKAGDYGYASSAASRYQAGITAGMERAAQIASDWGDDAKPGSDYAIACNDLAERLRKEAMIAIRHAGKDGGAG